MHTCRHTIRLLLLRNALVIVDHDLPRLRRHEAFRRSVAGPGERAHLGAADEHEVVLAVGVVEVHRLLGLVVRGHAERHDLELRQATRAYSLLHVRRP